MARRDPKPRTVRRVLLRVRCTEEERAGWADKARAEERSLSDYTRHVLSSEPMRRRTQPSEVDPTLLAAVGRVGSNLNQISHALNIDRKAGRAIDLIAVRTLLLAVTRQLATIVEDHSR
ncbi:plasmid mobilization protein [Parasedimentitalea huanghaiensis]|nr:plasmid mobilization relaxosome protein MobC [Zongyanglinia huanghaiensis]